MNKQLGFATLSMTLIMCMLVTMAILSMTQITSTNFKIVGNTIRSEQSVMAANAGIEYAVTKLNNKLIETSLSGNEKYSFTETPKIANGIATYTVTAEKVDSGSDKLIKLTSSGFSNDNTTTNPNATTSVVATKLPLLSYVPIPIIAKDSIRMGFYTHVVNHTGSLGTMWTGGGITISNFVWDTTNSDGSVNTSMGMYASDDNLKNATTDDFFTNFFSVNKDSVKSNSTVLDCISTCSDNDLIGLNGIIWIDGNINIGTATIGSATDSILLIATGTVNFNESNTEFNGVIYANSVTSETSVDSVEINGGIIGESSVNMDGVTNVVYNTEIIGNIMNEFYNYAKVPGTWTDM